MPVYLDGARDRPPEDVGGVGGYEAFLESIRDEDNPEREENLQWAEKDTGGRLFDPEYYHIDEVNRKLEHLLEDTPESARPPDDNHRLPCRAERRPGIMSRGLEGYAGNGRDGIAQ